MDRKKIAEMLGVPEDTTSGCRHRLSRAEANAEPYKKWNCFVDIISADPKSFSVGPARCASLAFLYESEVQNGGHDQYFDNIKPDFVEETIFALKSLGDNCRAKVLVEAYARYKSHSQRDCSSFDDQFHACKPNLIQILELHLEHNEARYIEWE